MSDELLPYYNSELAFIRNLGAEFAEANPKIAARLRLRAEGSEDPHVERLIEAFAYLNARIRHKLDDDFPEIADAMLGVLYPHYQAPIPSMAIVQFMLDRGQAELASGYTIDQGAVVETGAIHGEPCRFRTAFPVTLWPIEIVEASLTKQPFAAPAAPHHARSLAVLRLALNCISKDLTFAQMSMRSLRFFLKGQPQHVYLLYELLMTGVLGIALASSPTDPNPVLLKPQAIQPVGFERDQGMLPYPARSFLGYRLVSEYFAFPEKFLFFDLADLTRERLRQFGGRMEVFFYFARSSQDLEHHLSGQSFQLGCTPMVNLYRQRAEPVRLTQTQTEYRVVPDARRPAACEVYSVDRVTATSPDGETVEYQPFYSFKHAAEAAQQKTFWHGSRRRASRVAGQVDHGTELYLSLVDLNFKTSAPANWTLDVETTCLNRDLPRRLPFGGGQPYLQLSGGGPLSKVVCVTPPTPTFRPALKRGALWRLISHLSLNHLSLIDYEEGADALREILKLYDFADSSETRGMVDGILSVRSRRIVGRVGGEVSSGFARGVEVNVHFDEGRFTGSGVFLFACVLERFLAMYSSINSFSKLIATTNRREGELRRWTPRAGEKILL